MNIQNAERCLFTKQYVAYGKIGHFLCSVISQGKVVALDRWGGKWNHLLMAHRLATSCAKNYCNRTPIVKVILENVVTCFLGQSVVIIRGVFILKHKWHVSYSTLFGIVKSWYVRMMRCSDCFAWKIFRRAAVVRCHIWQKFAAFSAQICTEKCCNPLTPNVAIWIQL